MSVVLYTPGGSIHNPANYTDQGGLAGTIGAEQGNNLTLADIEIDIVEGLKAALIHF